MRHVLIMLLAALLTTCGVRPSLLEEVRALGELRVVTRNSPITYFIGQAGPEGPDYDLVSGFADYLGVELKIVEVDRFGDLLAEVEAGHAHLAAAGLTVHVQDSLTTDFSHTFTPAECAEGAGKILCISADRTFKLTLRALKPTPQVFRYVVTMKRVGLAGPFNWPVAVTITNGAIDRAGEIVDCRVTNTSLVCREF